MVRHNIEEYMATQGLRKMVLNTDKPEKIRSVAKRILDDKKLFEEYVSMRREKLEANRKKKVREERKKNLTGWKKWFIMILPEGLGLFLGVL